MCVCLSLVKQNRVMKMNMKDDFGLCRFLYMSVDYASFSLFAVLFQSFFFNLFNALFIYFPPPFDNLH